MKVITYNVNGIRAALNKGFADFIALHNPDILCLQEIKADLAQIPLAIFEDMGYYTNWFPAQKKGYSGTALLSKVKPKAVEYGCGHDLYDSEGRVLRADFDNFSVYSAYFPSGSSGDIRQQIKMEFLDYMLDYVNHIKKQFPNLILCGDYNICHKPIDIHDPVSNKNSSGFLPEEREWMDQFFESGFTDSFRLHNPQPHQYSWWSYRAAARARNKGWRIDYIAATNQMKDLIQSSKLHPNDNHSDHCAVETLFNL